MTTDAITAILSTRLNHPLEPVYTITRQDLLKVLATQLGSDALLLTDQEIELFQHEVQSVFDHYLDERQLYQLALEQFSITRNL